MPKYVTIEEYHVTARVPADLPDDDAEEVQAVLVSKPFLTRLRKAVTAAAAAHPPLAVVRVTISR